MGHNTVLYYFAMGRSLLSSIILFQTVVFDAKEKKP
jgi:hypothetical protein